MEQNLHPHSEIIDRLGGTASVARMFDISQPSVTNWRHSGIPKARMMYLKLARPDVLVPELKEQSHAQA